MPHATQDPVPGLGHTGGTGRISLPAAAVSVWLCAAVLAQHCVSTAGGECASDCRAGGFSKPVLYFEFRNTSAEECCRLCQANATCAFAIRRESDGMCWPSPATATAWQAGKPGVRTCRTAKAPPWPAPTPPAPFPLPLLAWPMLRPQPGATPTIGATLVAASAGFAARCAGGGCPAPDVLAWYQGRIARDGVQAGTITAVEVKVRDGGALLGADESYALKCSPVANGAGTCTVVASHTVGALRGLETLAHLAHAASIPLPLSTTDAPRFPYRGLLIDSARHFLPVASVKRVIDAMSATKLNVLHWHLTDTTSFPVESNLYPQLAGRGAFHPTLLYTQASLADVVAYAASRGVRVVPEFDVRTRVHAAPERAARALLRSNVLLAAAAARLDRGTQTGNTNLRRQPSCRGCQVLGACRSGRSRSFLLVVGSG